MADFYQYMMHQQDDSPLYIYDSSFGGGGKVSQWLVIVIVSRLAGTGRVVV